jgi:uncharacterized protein (DUF58 family)
VLKRAVLVAGLLVFAVTAYITAVPLAFKMVYTAVVVVGASWLWARAGARGLRLTRSGGGGAYQLGEEFSEELVVHNTSRLSLPWIEVIDRSEIPGYSAGRPLSLPARRQRRWRAEGHLQARGRYALGPVDVVCGDPFGIFQRTIRIPTAGSITVYPRLVDVARMLPATAHTSGDAISVGRHIDVPPDALGIREYDPGDGFNRIHWPSTARLGRPMSRSFEKLEGANLLLILDLQSSVQRGTGPESTLEYAVSLAASVAVSVLSRGQSVALLCNDRQRTTIHAARSGQQLRRIFDFLAIVEADGTASLATLLQRMSVAARGYHSLVVVTPSVEAEWIDRLADLSRGGTRVSTVLHLEQESFERAGPPAAAEAAWRQLRRDAHPEPPAARSLLTSRRRDQVQWWSIGAGSELFGTSLTQAVPLELTEAVG